MKTIALSMILGLSLIACKKDNHKMTESKAEQDSLQVNKPVKKEIAHNDIRELKPEEISLQLKSKANDTLYITNFFATWCGPCMAEMPHFINKMKELSAQPVKFTFVSSDDKEDWATKVKDFADKNNLRKNIVLLNDALVEPDFYKTNFKTWTGESIPFTIMKKGDLTDEYLGGMTKEMLDSKITKMLSVNSSTKIDEQKEKNKISASTKGTL